MRDGWRREKKLQPGRSHEPIGVLLFKPNLSYIYDLNEQHAQVIILAVKPDVVPQVLRELSQRVTPRHLIISIAAGATLQLLQHVCRQVVSLYTSLL